MYNIVKYQPSEYGSYRFPTWAEVLGILMGVLSCLMIPVGMVVAVLREEGTLWEVGGFGAQHCWEAPQKCVGVTTAPLLSLYPPAISASSLLEVCVPVPPCRPWGVRDGTSQGISIQAGTESR